MPLRSLVAIGGTDAPAGGADASIATTLLHRLIEGRGGGRGMVTWAVEASFQARQGDP